MKSICILVAAFLLSLGGAAQQPAVQLGTGQTTSLVFAAPIIHVDRGSKDILVQRVNEAPHILLAKAASPDLSQTNLSVVTADGALYSFPIVYDSLPQKWVINVPSLGAPSLEATAKSLLAAPALLRSLKERGGGIEMRITGIYVQGNMLFYQLRLSNSTPIDYDVDALRFYIRDQRKAKRTAQQELVLTPHCWAVPVEKVRGNSSLTTVVALEKFTIPDAKYFGVELLERSGGRHLLLKVGNRHLFRAKAVPTL
ncbi:MAG: conjugative transposon protein TraN [Chitinophagaceae bacterium]|nr:MAG: conjugative transposon protein TraN [Chitinophagaceae bacterium]